MHKQSLSPAHALQGATVVDFAYHVHTEVGNQMVSARVNGKPASVAHVLGDADVVEIRCYQGPPTPCQILTHQVRDLCDSTAGLQQNWLLLSLGLAPETCCVLWQLHRPNRRPKLVWTAVLLRWC